MNNANGSFVESRRFWVISILMIGSLWGLLEATAGIGLRGGCARFLSGSMLTGGSLLFFSAAYTLTGRLWLIVLLPVIAGLFRVYTGLLLGQPLMSGAVANPVFAFFMEAAAFCAVVYLIRREHVRSLIGAGLAGMTAAVLSVSLFLPVKLVTGIPACVVPGTDYPLAIWGLPVAAAIAAVSMPLGFHTGAFIRRRLTTPAQRHGRLLTGASVAVSVVCLLVVTIAHIQ